MTAAVRAGTPRLEDLGASRTDRVQTLVYSVALTQVAVGIVSAIYVLITQAVWWGHSLKGSWDNLDKLWHFAAVPGIGSWLVANYDIGRHLYLRDAPESIVAFALVAMIVPKLAPMKAKAPLIERILVFLRMPSRYQHLDGLARLHWPGRAPKIHDRTSPAQFVMLLPSMLLAAIPGEIVISVAVFGGMALAHRAGYTSPWLTPESPWVPIAVGIGGGIFAGHRPAVQAGDTVQGYFLGKRRAVAYRADDLLVRFVTGQITQEQVRDKLTALRAARPSRVYPPSYVKRYDVLLAERAPVRRYSWVSSAAIVATVVILAVLAAYGLYVRKIGVPAGHFWMP